MAKVRTVTTSASDDALDTLVTAAFFAADVNQSLKIAFEDAHKVNDIEICKRTFRDGWVARILSVGQFTEAALVEGRRVNDLAGNKTAKADDLKRNPVQERAYGAAKVALNALLKDLGIETGRGGVGGRAPRQTTADASEAGEDDNSILVEATPSLDSVEAVEAYVERMAALLDRTGRKNAEHVRAVRLQRILDAMRDYSAD